jgi:ABC-type Na+ efflux pump permease subunit
MSNRQRASGPAPGFRPEFTLLLLYFFMLFLFFALLLALPDLLEGMRTLPPAASIEEERAAGAAIAQQAVKGKLFAAFLATVVALGLGAYTRVLPGIRKRR